MGNTELFIKKIYDIVAELQVPLVDERFYDKVSIKSNKATDVQFIFEEDETVIRGFLGLADYFHTVVIKHKDKFYIPHENKLFILKNGK